MSGTQIGIPLVTIIVITYNSEKFVLETLNSARNQTYNNLELIVTDDCSIDSTVSIVEEWISLNKKYFKRVELITSDINTGLSANCNRALNRTTGTWIKLIAGDDILAEKCVELNLIFSQKGEIESPVIISQITPFNQISSIDYSIVEPDAQHEIFQSTTLPQRQLYLLIRGKFIVGASIFYNTKVLRDNGGFDEKYRSFEDYPIFLKFTSNDVKLHFLQKVTVYYRRHDSALGVLTNSQVLAPYFKDVVKLMIRYSKIHGDSLLIINSYWNSILTKAVFYLNNTGTAAVFINNIRTKLAPIRIRGIMAKINN